MIKAAVLIYSGLIQTEKKRGTSGANPQQ